MSSNKKLRLFFLAALLSTVTIRSFGMYLLTRAVYKKLRETLQEKTFDSNNYRIRLRYKRTGRPHIQIFQEDAKVNKKTIFTRKKKRVSNASVINETLLRIRYEDDPDLTELFDKNTGRRIPSTRPESIQQVEKIDDAIFIKYQNNKIEMVNARNGKIERASIKKSGSTYIVQASSYRYYLYDANTKIKTQISIDPCIRLIHKIIKWRVVANVFYLAYYKRYNGNSDYPPYIVMFDKTTGQEIYHNKAILCDINENKMLIAESPLFATRSLVISLFDAVQKRQTARSTIIINPGDAPIESMSLHNNGKIIVMQHCHYPYGRRSPSDKSLSYNLFGVNNGERISQQKIKAFSNKIRKTHVIKKSLFCIENEYNTFDFFNIHTGRLFASDVKTWSIKHNQILCTKDTCGTDFFYHIPSLKKLRAFIKQKDQITLLSVNDDNTLKVKTINTDTGKTINKTQMKIDRFSSIQKIENQVLYVEDSYGSVDLYLIPSLKKIRFFKFQKNKPILYVVDKDNMFKIINTDTGNVIKEAPIVQTIKDKIISVHNPDGSENFYLIPSLKKLRFFKHQKKQSILYIVDEDNMLKITKRYHVYETAINGTPMQIRPDKAIVDILYEPGENHILVFYREKTQAGTYVYIDLLDIRDSRRINLQEIKSVNLRIFGEISNILLEKPDELSDATPNMLTIEHKPNTFKHFGRAYREHFEEIFRAKPFEFQDEDVIIPFKMYCLDTDEKISLIFRKKNTPTQKYEIGTEEEEGEVVTATQT